MIEEHNHIQLQQPSLCMSSILGELFSVEELSFCDGEKKQFHDVHPVLFW
jgi:hypothetical protein